MYIHKTDRQVSDGIYLSLSCLYNKKLKDKADTVRSVIEATAEEFLKLLNVPDDIRFRVAPIKGRFSGRYNHDARTVELDCRLHWHHAMLVLAHELVHAEQFNENRLETRYLPSVGYAYFWHGKRWKDKGTSYQAYLNQPWEKEAYERQTKLVEQVCATMDVKYGE